MRSAGWADLYSWQVDRGRGEPLSRQIYLQIRAAIVSQTLKAKTRLPSTRDLAARLQVSRSVVVEAYEQLIADGFLAGKIGSGTHISELPSLSLKGPSRSGVAAARPAAPVSLVPKRYQLFEQMADSALERQEKPFMMGRCVVDRRTVERWRILNSRVFRSVGGMDLGYSDPRGLPALRSAICDYLRVARGVRCEPEQIVVTAGAQQAMDLATRVLFEPGDDVWVEDPVYAPTLQLLTAARLKVRPIPVDAKGLNVAAGIRSAPKARAAFVTPSDQHPLGVVLSMARRLQLLEWAREAGAWIIEDDYNSELRYSGPPLPSLQGMDEGDRVLYVGTLTKVLFPGLRVGYLVVPRSLLRAFIGARCLMDRQPPTLHQTALARFMHEGHLSTHIRRTRIVYREARDAITSELLKLVGAKIQFEVPNQGMNLIGYLPRGVSDVAIEQSAALSGVVVRALSRSYVSAPPRSALLMGFTGYTPQQLREAAAKLAMVMRKQAR